MHVLRTAAYVQICLALWCCSCSASLFWHDNKTVTRDVVHEEMPNHFFIGVYGLPRSGNDWIYLMLRYTPDCSTMIEGCYRHTLKRICRGKRFRGTEGNVDKKYMSQYQALWIRNKYCTVRESERLIDAGRGFFDMWMMHYWDVDKTYLVENTDTNMLHIPIVHKAASRFAGAKYIITMKHPFMDNKMSGVTTSWMRSTQEDIEDKLTSVEIYLTMDGTRRAGYSSNSSNTGCSTFSPYGSGSLSWISIMHVLHGILKDDIEWSGKHVRIVRYEDFQNEPLEVCKRLHKFLFLDDRPQSLGDGIKNSSSPYFWDYSQVETHCKSLFPGEPQNPTGQGPPSRAVLNNERDIIPDDGHMPWPFPFSRYLNNGTEHRVMNEFSQAYAKNKFNAETKEWISNLDEKLWPFGYMIRPNNFFVPRAERHKFAHWDLFTAPV